MSSVAPAFIAVLLFSAAGRAQEGDGARLLSRLREKYNDVDRLSLTFAQKTVFAVSKAEQVTEGKLVLGKGNQYRITLGDRLIVSDGRTVWSMSKSNSQVIVDRFRDDPSGITPERLLARLPEDYRAVSTGTEKIGRIRTTVLKLTPGSPGGQVKWLKLWVDEDEMAVRRLVVMDLGENEITYDLGDVTVDPDVPDSVFTFTAPAGTEILDLR
ncbi:MAG TPA: outer membrane lipoprotein carrier protein LolA [Bacteroidota bacterium]|nr:outer membrane lipoprotein carrier protein LolA [Bacteroidota bacterium]